MSSSYRDPRVAAAQVVSEKSAVHPRVRFVSGGAIEVATARRGRAIRHRIDGDGHEELLEISERSGRWLLGRRVILLGFASLAAAALSGVLLGWEEDWRGVALVISAMALWWTGGAIQSSGYRRLKRSFGIEDGWFELAALARLSAGKPPITWLTMPQLRSVEALATERNNVAVVRVDSEGAVEAVTEHRGLLERHGVATSGEATLLDSARVSRRRFSTDTGRARERYGGTRGDWAVVNLNEPD